MLFPTPIAWPGWTKTRLMSYCTRNELVLAVNALPSKPSAQVYQVPAVAGVFT